MKTGRIRGVVKELLVEIDGIKYKGKKWGFEFSVDLNGEVHGGMCEEARSYWVGSAFFEKNFGGKKTKEIKRRCINAVKDYIEEVNETLSDSLFLQIP